MAGYIVTSGSDFTPFSYDELVKPVMQMTELHNTAADEFDRLTMDTEALRNYIDGSKDRKTQELYDSYIQKLETLRDNLLSKGYTAGTRRDLSAARAGYSGDIARIAKAVETRQNRSKEYWDTAHKNPDMVMGKDPGTESLDSYLANDNFGQNWYSYSGNTFADEVAADMDARANALLRDPEILKNPKIAGYIQEKRQLGFTNDELDFAGEAAWNFLKGDRTQYDSLDDITKIAADVLINRMSSTGASFGENGNLSDNEYKRLFQYGLRGAARGIKAPEIKDYEDKNWELQKQAALIGMRNHASEQQTPGGYYVDPTTVTRTSENARKIAGEIGKIYSPEAFQNGNTVNINMPDGTLRQVGSVAEMTSLLYDTPERQFIKDNFGGIDIGLPSQNWLGTTESRQEFTVKRGDKTFRMSTGKLSRADARRLGITADNPVAIRTVVNGRNVLNESYTRAFNEQLASHQKHVEDITRLNRKTLRQNNLAVSPGQERKLEEKYNLDSRLSSQDIPAVLAMRELHSNGSPATIVDSSESMSSVRQDYQNILVSSLRQAVKYSGKKASTKQNSQDNYAFYPAKKGGDGFEEKGYTDLSAIFTLDSNGNPKNGSLEGIEVYPSDLAKGMIRIQTDKGVFGVSADMLGSITGNAINSPEFQSSLSALMLPFTNTDKTLLDAGNTIVSVLDDYGNTYEVKMEDIIRNPQLRQMYYNTVIRYINMKLAQPREMKGQEHFQTTSSTSTKPQGLNILGQ